MHVSEYKRHRKKPLWIKQAPAWSPGFYCALRTSRIARSGAFFLCPGIAAPEPVKRLTARATITPIALKAPRKPVQRFYRRPFTKYSTAHKMTATGLVARPGCARSRCPDPSRIPRNIPKYPSTHLFDPFFDRFSDDFSHVSRHPDSRDSYSRYSRWSR